MFLSSSLFPFEEFPIVLCTVICILFLGSAGKTVSTPPRLVSQNTSISRHTDSCQRWAGVPRQSKQNFPLGFWKSSWEIHASGFMSCDKDVSQLVYLLPLQKSVPGNKSNKEKKSRAETEKKKRERENAGGRLWITMRQREKSWWPCLRLLVRARHENTHSGRFQLYQPSTPFSYLLL